MLAEEKRWYRVKDVAQILEVSPQRVSQMAASGLIPHYRIGRTIKVDREEFARWLASRRRGPEN
jgi:excisionase family DNA binding protein